MIIKVSTPWSHTDYRTRIPDAKENSQYGYSFDDNLKECDYWVIWGGIKSDKMSTYCPPENIIYLTDEVHEQRFFNGMFLQQFAAVATCRMDLNHPGLISTHELNTWVVNKSYKDCYYGPAAPKTKLLSVVCSDQTWLPGHKARFAFVNKLIGHFKDRLDVYGRGFNPIADKAEALNAYKYSIAIENSFLPGYFTEKLTDCFLTETLPIYFGCPDAEKYFGNDAFERIDIQDFNAAVKKIEALLKEDIYEQRLLAVKRAKRHYLRSYNIFSALPGIISKNFNERGLQKRNCVIKNEYCFQRGHQLNKGLAHLFKILNVPGRFHFSIHLDQRKTFANYKQPR